MSLWFWTETRLYHYLFLLGRDSIGSLKVKIRGRRKTLKFYTKIIRDFCRAVIESTIKSLKEPLVMYTFDECNRSYLYPVTNLVSLFSVLFYHLNRHSHDCDFLNLRRTETDQECRWGKTHSQIWEIRLDSSYPFAVYLPTVVKSWSLGYPRYWFLLILCKSLVEGVRGVILFEVFSLKNRSETMNEWRSYWWHQSLLSILPGLNSLDNEGMRSYSHNTRLFIR